MFVSLWLSPYDLPKCRNICGDSSKDSSTFWEQFIKNKVIFVETAFSYVFLHVKQAYGTLNYFLPFVKKSHSLTNLMAQTEHRYVCLKCKLTYETQK